MKKIVSTVLALCLMLGCLPLSAAAAGSFRDVPVGQYYTGAVDWAVENGITSGTSATTFSPNSKCTRGQIVTFLWRAAGTPASSYPMQFADVPAKEYYADAVKWAVEAEVTSGTGKTTFSPDLGCTRAQAVTFLYRAAGEPAFSKANTFTDVPAGTYYSNAVSWAVENGITTGTSTTTFSPNSVCTRAQIVTFLYRFLGGESEPVGPELTREERIQKVCDFIEKTGTLSEDRDYKYTDFCYVDDVYAFLNHYPSEKVLGFDYVIDDTNDSGLIAYAFMDYDLQTQTVASIYCSIETAGGQSAFLTLQAAPGSITVDRADYSFAITGENDTGIAEADLVELSNAMVNIAFQNWEYMMEKLGTSLQDLGLSNYINFGAKEGPFSGDEFLKITG